jgi:hypothetical protein
MQFEEPEVMFDLTPFRQEFYEFQNDKLAYEMAKKKWELRRDRFKKMAGNANRFILDGIVVATHAISGAFNKAKLAKELPHIYEEFLVEQTVQVFDEAAFAEKYPMLYNSDDFRARALRFKL